MRYVVLLISVLIISCKTQETNISSELPISISTTTTTSTTSTTTTSTTTTTTTTTQPVFNMTPDQASITWYDDGNWQGNFTTETSLAAFQARDPLLIQSLQIVPAQGQ